MGKLDLTKHMLVPKHTKLGQKEKQKLFERYNISEAELPKISNKDPAVAKLKAKPGDVIRVERPSVTSKQTMFYRVVISG